MTPGTENDKCEHVLHGRSDTSTPYRIQASEYMNSLEGALNPSNLATPCISAWQLPGHSLSNITEKYFMTRDGPGICFATSAV